MKALLTAYKVLATVVGISIVTLLVVGIPLKYVHQLWPSVLPVGSTGQELGDAINLYLGTAHGFIYMAFVFVALILAQQARWPLVFTVVTLVCGTIPFLSFWAERRAIKRVEREHPEVSASVVNS